MNVRAERREQMAVDRPTNEVPEPIAAFLDSVDYCERDGFYRAKVRFGERDHATVSIIPGGAAEKAFHFFIDLYAAIAKMGQGLDEVALVEAFREIANGEKREQFWLTVDDIFGCCLCAWHMPERMEAYELKEVPAPPNANMEYPERSSVIKNLPLTVIVRVIVGAIWLLKNSLGRSK